MQSSVLNADQGSVTLYQTPDGCSALDVRLNGETVWLNLNQMASLFERDKSVISRHLRNVLETKELNRDSVVAFFATTATDGKTYRVEFFNLDAILAVGYRVNSRRGTEFRIWATQILRDHLVIGYTLNEKRLQSQVARLTELQSAVDIMGRIIANKAITGTESEGLLKVITDYSLALRLLDQYDHQQLRVHGTTAINTFVLTYEAAISAIARMAEIMGSAADGLFGREKDKGLASGIGAVYQTFNGHDLYPSTEEKAAHLLYFVVKNHAFVDGNKRIAAFLFIWFLSESNLLYRKDGSKRLADNALVALTLLIAESKPGEKDAICKVIVNLINRENI
jgi:prophage maintenance system killer protein